MSAVGRLSKDIAKRRPCSRCLRIATHMPTVCVPAMGHPAEPELSIRFTIDLELCVHHAEQFDPLEILDNPPPDQPRPMRDILLESFPQLDMTRVFVIASALDSEDVLRMKEQKMAARMLGPAAGNA